MRFLVFASIASCGCQLVGDYAEFDYGTPPEPAEHHPCDVLPSAKDDDRGLAVMARIDIPDQKCFWVDRTEVTVEQYVRWQNDVPADGVEWEPTWCAWKGDRTDPISAAGDACVAEFFRFDLQPFAPRKPMRCVDFCEAEAFCRWAGKRLCYDSSGVGVQGPRGNPQEWHLTCNNQQSTPYPWGNTAGDFCNTDQSEDGCLDATVTCGPVPVGQEEECSTPGGVVDLLGNVAEWVFSCNYVDSERPLEPTACLTRGGGYDDPLRACDAELNVPSDDRRPALGFRCCADLTTEEDLATRATRP